MELSTYSSKDYSYETPYFANGWNLDRSYDICVRIQDSYNYVDVYYTVLQASCVIDIEKGGVGIGGYWSKGALDVVGDTNVSGTLTTDGNIESKGFINSARNITSQGGFFGKAFVQHHTAYGAPLEVGRYIDLHNIGSTNDVDVRLDTGGTRDRLRISGGGDLSRYVEIGMNSNGSFLKDSPSGKFLQMRTDRLTYDGYTVPHNWRQGFTPFLYADTGSFTTSSATGQAIYLGDLVFIQGRVIASKGGHSGGVAIGGLPVSNLVNYAPVTIGFFGGVTDAMNSLTYGINGYVEHNASHIVLNFTLRNAGWQQLKCVHLTTGIIDVTFSAVYRYR